ncbi:MAG: hypothetical protein AAFX99_00105 [Myxococcota bacterium]
MNRAFSMILFTICLVGSGGCSDNNDNSGAPGTSPSNTSSNASDAASDASGANDDTSQPEDTSGDDAAEQGDSEQADSGDTGSLDTATPQDTAVSGDTAPMDTDLTDSRFEDTASTDIDPSDTAANTDSTSLEDTEPGDTTEDTAPFEDTRPEDAAPEDTRVADTTPEDTMVVDTAPEDTMVTDTAQEDTLPEDTGFADTAPEDTANVDTAPDGAVICPELDAFPELAPAPLPVIAQGRTETTSANGFTDDYLYDAQEYLKVGIRREWGGSIIFYGLTNGSPGMNGTNTIDANDTGREVQVAFYDPDRIRQGCAFDASCRSQAPTCPNSISYLGWNPVQGGNRCNVGSGVESVAFNGTALQSVTVPLHWNPTWDRPDCDNSSGCSGDLRQRRSEVRLTQRLRFVRTHIVELDYTLANDSDLAHAETLHELPTVYTANGNNGPDLWRLKDAAGTVIPIDTPAGNDGFFYENFDSPAPWVALQNDNDDYGVGIYYENGTQQFQGWQQRALPFNNVRARIAFPIPARSVIRARAYLIIGGFSTIAAEAQWLGAQLAPFGVLDAPGHAQTVQADPNGQLTVRGWALDNRAVQTIEATLDGTGPATTLATGVERPDVCLVWPGYPNCPAVGFSGTVPIPADGCGHLLEVFAIDSDGNRSLLGAAQVATP